MSSFDPPTSPVAVDIALGSDEDLYNEEDPNQSQKDKEWEEYDEYDPPKKLEYLSPPLSETQGDADDVLSDAEIPSAQHQPRDHSTPFEEYRPTPIEAGPPIITEEEAATELSAPIPIFSQKGPSLM